MPSFICIHFVWNKFHETVFSPALCDALYFSLRWVFVAACRLSLVAASGGCSSLWCVCFSLRWLCSQSMGSRRAGFSSCGSRALEHRLSSCGAQASLLCSMGDLPGPGLEPTSPALAGGFLTTMPPGKACDALKKKKLISLFQKANDNSHYIDFTIDWSVGYMTCSLRNTELERTVLFYLILSCFLNFIYLFYLFMAVLGLCFCVRAFSSCGKWGPLFITVRGPLTITASLVAEHRLQTRRLSNCGSRA